MEDSYFQGRQIKKIRQFKAVHVQKVLTPMNNEEFQQADHLLSNLNGKKS